MITLADIERLAKPHGIRVVDCGAGHFQLHGQRLVNYYPESKKRTAYVAGTTHGKARCSVQDAILMALAPATEERRAQRSQQTAAKRRMLERAEARDGRYKCWWCPHWFLPDELTVEHLVPLSRGGLNSRSNRVLACAPCNNSRGNSMPEIPPPLSPAKGA